MHRQPEGIGQGLIMGGKSLLMVSRVRCSFDNHRESSGTFCPCVSTYE